MLVQPQTKYKNRYCMTMYSFDHDFRVTGLGYHFRVTSCHTDSASFYTATTDEDRHCIWIDIAPYGLS